METPALGRYYTEPRRDVARLVPPGALRILDVGCGAGGLGRALLERNPARTMIGVEPVAVAVAAAARHYARVLPTDLEGAGGELPSLAPFDSIVLADVLEHHADPAAVLARLRDWLAPDGTVIASIPNAAHWSVIAGLLRGRFDYAERGILDRTHLRFFTRSSFAALARESGYAVAAVHTNYRLWQARGLRYDHLVALPLGLYVLRHLFAFQYLFVLEPGSEG